MKTVYVLLISLLFAVACSSNDPEPIVDPSGLAADTAPCGAWVLTPYDGLYYRTCSNSTSTWPQYKKPGDPDPATIAGKLGEDICTCSLWESGFAIGVVSKICVKVHNGTASWTQPIYRPEGGVGDVDLHVDTEWICDHWQ
jgi:hypothetical protein